MIRIGLIGDYNGAIIAHQAIPEAVRLAGRKLGVAVESDWLATDEIGDLRKYTGLWCVPGSPYRSMEGALRAIRFAREARLPFLGTCGGFQHMILEYARNVLNFKDAQHAEYDPYASDLFVSRLACSLAGREMELAFVEGSKVASIYGSLSATEEYYCNFGVNPDKVSLLTGSALRTSGSDAEGELRVIELPDHPFFVGTLFVPQTRSTTGNPHPLVNAFLKAASEKNTSNRTAPGVRSHLTA